MNTTKQYGWTYMFQVPAQVTPTVLLLMKIVDVLYLENMSHTRVHSWCLLSHHEANKFKNYHDSWTFETFKHVEHDWSRMWFLFRGNFCFRDWCCAVFRFLSSRLWLSVGRFSFIAIVLSVFSVFLLSLCYLPTLFFKAEPTRDG